MSNALQAMGVIPLSGVKGTYTQLHAIFDLKNLQNSSGSTSRRRVVSLRSFEHIDLIFMVGKGIDHSKLLSICFFTITFNRF